MTAPRFALFRGGQQISKAHSTREAARAETYAHGAIINRAADFPGDEEARSVLADGYEIRPLTDDDPFITQSERVAEIAQRAFGDAKDAALAENERLGIKSYGTVTDPPKANRS
jgi:hypothetical protein